MKNFLSFCVATLCLYFAFNQVNIEDIYRALSDANMIYIFVAFIATFVTFILRSLRWKILLDSPKELKIQKYISTTHVGYFLNNILPFRAGDLARAKLLSNNSTNIKFSFLVGSLVAEKIIDLWIVGLFSIFIILFGFKNVLGLEFSIGILLLYVITSLIIFGGASQIIFMQLLSGGASSLVAITSVGVINSRHLLYGAVLSEYLEKLSFFKKLFISYFIVDQGFAESNKYLKKNNSQTNLHYHVLGGGITLWLFWQISTLSGIILGSFIPEELEKFVEVMPISAAFSFIISAKFSSDPAIPSARATHASFPEAIIIPFNKFSTDT